MTQAKKTESKQTKKEIKSSQNTALNLQKRYLSLSPHDQVGVTNFFNLHNAAHYVYDGLSEEAQKYVAFCIRLSQNANQIEAKEGAQDL